MLTIMLVIVILAVTLYFMSIQQTEDKGSTDTSTATTITTNKRRVIMHRIRTLATRVIDWLNDHPLHTALLCMVYAISFIGYNAWTLESILTVPVSNGRLLLELVQLVVGAGVCLVAIISGFLYYMIWTDERVSKPRRPLPWMKYGSWGWWMIAVLVIVGCSGGGGEPVQGWTAHPDDRTYGHRLQVAKWEVGKLTAMEQIFPDHAAYDVERVMGAPGTRALRS